MSEPPRVYTIAEILAKLHWSRNTFCQKRKAGLLPFLENIAPPRSHPRYRADLVDRWLAGQWQADARRRYFGAARRR